MKITDLKCTVLGGNPVIRITTDEGICSWGEEEFSKPYLKSQVLFYRDLILGEEPTKWGIRVLDLNGETLSLSVVDEFSGQDREGLLIDFAKLIRHKSLFPTNGKDNLQSLAIIFTAISFFGENRPVSIQELLLE